MSRIGQAIAALPGDRGHFVGHLFYRAGDIANEPVLFDSLTDRMLTLHAMQKSCNVTPRPCLLR